MNITDLPLGQYVVSFGPDSRVFDALLISGPLILALIVLVGRNMVTFALAGCYLLLFVAGIAREAVSMRRRQSASENTRT